MPKRPNPDHQGDKQTRGEQKQPKGSGESKKRDSARQDMPKPIQGAQDDPRLADESGEPRRTGPRSFQI